MKRKTTMTPAPASPKQPKVAKKETEEKQLVVIQWLRENYYLGSGGSTPKALLFQDYLDMCRRESLDATSNSAFGKLVRTAFPGVQSSRKGPRGAAKHQYKNLLPLGEGGPRPVFASAEAAAAHMGLAPLSSSSSSSEEDEYEEEISSSYTYSTAFGDSSSSSSSSSSSPSTSPHHYMGHCQPSCAEMPPQVLYEEGHELSVIGHHQLHHHQQQQSSPTLSISYSSTPASSPVVPTSAEWMAPPMALDHMQQPCQQQCCNAAAAATAMMPWTYRSVEQLELEQLPSSDSSSSASSSFDDLLDAYGVDATQAAAVAAASSAAGSMWDGDDDDVESFFSPAVAVAAPYQMLSSGAYGSMLPPPASSVDFGVLGGGPASAERRDEEAQLMWCSRSSVGDILSTSKGEEWISNLLQGCN